MYATHTNAPPHMMGLIVFPVLLIMVGIEAWLLRQNRRRSLDWRESLCSAGVALGHHASGLATGGLVLGGLDWAWRHRLATVPLDTFSAWALLFLLEEFAYYVYHRASHEVRWFWATHAVHHTPEQLNLSAAYRLGWTSVLGGAAFFFAPLVWLGFKPEAVLAAVAVNLGYQFWLHTELVPNLGAFEWVFNTPSHHRVHHASNPEYLDCNYGGVLIVFDRMFGTHTDMKVDIPCRYGLVHPLRSHNPFVVVFAEWRALFSDLLRSRGLGEVFGYLFRAPSWRPDGRGQTTHSLRLRSGLQ